METIRVFSMSDVKVIDEIVRNSCPMTPEYVPVMVKSGMYGVVDSSGKRIPTEQVLRELVK